jgi:hypothetical protein
MPVLSTYSGKEGPSRLFDHQAGFRHSQTIAGIRFFGNCQKQDDRRYENRLQQGLLPTGTGAIQIQKGSKTSKSISLK